MSVESTKELYPRKVKITLVQLVDNKLYITFCNLNSNLEIYAKNKLVAIVHVLIYKDLQ